MADHHDEHHSIENKPVSFTVPFILASVTIIIIVLFLSLCDPKPHHGEHGGHENEAHAHSGAVMENHHESEESKAAAGTTEAKDTMSVESTVPSESPHH
jgi:hypothetical protein